METIEGPAIAAPSGAHAFQTEDEEEEWAVIDNELLAQALLPAAVRDLVKMLSVKSCVHRFDPTPPPVEQEEGGGNGENEASGADLIDAITQAPALELSRCRLHRINHLNGFR